MMTTLVLGLALNILEPPEKVFGLNVPGIYWFMRLYDLYKSKFWFIHEHFIWAQSPAQ